MHGRIGQVEMELLDYLGFNMAAHENIRLILIIHVVITPACKKYGVEGQKYTCQIEKILKHIL